VELGVGEAKRLRRLLDRLLRGRDKLAGLLQRRQGLADLDVDLQLLRGLARRACSSWDLAWRTLPSVARPSKMDQVDWRPRSHPLAVDGVPGKGFT
jgi:hypothetical protein